MRMHAIWVAVLAAVSVFGQSPAMTNDDVIKLAKSGLSEQFVTDLIDKQGAKLRIVVTASGKQG